ncbi:MULTISPECIES: hypothetical protein [Tenacibaculum]|uniref:Uncharacterized protein n=1 Tax=Tenacibaculum mesophilum TaxID=104268 RepID=A0AAE9SF17_9FLAO|nr:MULTISPECIES: hypothetical protein [Tenacibaculum]KAF9657703.1 hypothetical protein HBA12_10745 [Tenacibaculum mesophilum]MCG7502474.1 hypothetical protein [Tenacibaculum sp. Mcav3-52]UTD14278.1 hypothetical protein HER15_01770 [Tenacibaculum mesophilum]
MKKEIKLTPILTLIILAILFSFIYGLRAYQKNKLNKGAFITYATIEKLKENTRKGKSGRTDIVYFYFIKNDSVIHKLKQIPPKSIKKEKLKLNETFKIRVAKSDYNVFEIDFDERIDTVIRKQDYKTQVYNTFTHHNIIEQ